MSLRRADGRSQDLAATADGIATVLISPQAKANFEDDTAYDHYSLLKTISEAWKLPYLGHAAHRPPVEVDANQRTCWQATWSFNKQKLRPLGKGAGQETCAEQVRMVIV